MQSVLVDIPEMDLREIEKIARENHRSRKAQLEMIIDEWVQKENGKK